jgi:hypothetical protein
MKKSLLRRDLTVTGAFLVILAALAAGGMLFLGYRVYDAARARAHLRSSIPKLCEELSRQRQTLVSAIGAYKQALGSYPPDHVLKEKPLVIDAVTNQLLYELMGAVYSPTNDTFYTRDFSPIRGVDAKTFFNVGSFRNSGKTPATVPCFLKLTDLNSTASISDRPHEVFLVAFWPNWEGVDAELLTQVDAATWCYNSSAPLHNPGTYDLWIEIRTALTNITCGNW